MSQAFEKFRALVKDTYPLDLVYRPNALGIPVTGYGHRVELGGGITRDTAEALLAADLNSAAAEYSMAVQHGFLPEGLDDVRRVAIEMLIYTHGIGWLTGHTNFLLAVKLGDWPAAKRHLIGLCSASVIEAVSHMLLTGQWPKL